MSVAEGTICVQINVMGKSVYLPVTKETVQYYITKQYPRLSIIGDTPNDKAKYIKRWRKGSCETKKFTAHEMKTNSAIMD